MDQRDVGYLLDFHSRLFILQHDSSHMQCRYGSSEQPSVHVPDNFDVSMCRVFAMSHAIDPIGLPVNHRLLVGQRWVPAVQPTNWCRRPKLL